VIKKEFSFQKSTLKKRIDSFKNWPKKNILPSIFDLSSAGFLFLGKEDHVKCVYCNGSVGNWKSCDNPWIEHARWYPKCVFLLMSKGQDFIDEVQLKMNDKSENEILNIQESFQTEKKSFKKNSCKICMKEKANIAFLPCGHLICCPSCSLSSNFCKICYKKITDFVRIV
jgi:hypothetical protein